MEPFPKRQRLYPPTGRGFPQSFDREEVYYNEDDFIGEEDEEEEEDAHPDYDPDSNLQQKRARLDYKLKSTFEAIFEKYGKDFSGIGDEIDLATGEIVVNNGHILEMADERDAGDVERAHSVPTEVTEGSDDLPSSALEEFDGLEEEDEEDEEEENEEEASEDELVEDDLILRGFAQANRFHQTSLELVPLKKAIICPQRPRKVLATPRDIPKKALPSRSEILAQFGPQLGPQIVKYVTKKSVSEDTHIEPAWRAPELPSFEPRKRDLKRPAVLPPEPERSPSPEQAKSIWAPPSRRGPKKGFHLDRLATFREESTKHQGRFALDPLGFPIGLEHPTESSPRKRTRRAFTEEEDQILLDWVTRVRRKDLTLGDRLWKELEANYPSHSWKSWKAHYKRQFTYLSNLTEESEVSVSEASESSVYVAPQSAPARRPDLISQGLAQDTAHVRPDRIRKPAQKDSRIISWTEAVDALESLDPDLHAGILEDANVTKAADTSFIHPSAVPTKQATGTGPNAGPVGPRINKDVSQPRAKQVIDLTGLDDDPSSVEVTAVWEQHLIPSAPCPHADCIAFPTILYRLQRRDDEDLSEMCLHLFRVHHTTPFPCGEINCSRKGEEGYFMQADLVRHVRNNHPSIGALHRLRGRVDSELLNRNIELATPPDASNRPVSQQRDSDFMSPRKAPSARRLSSSQMHSSTSDPDRTPRGPTTVLGVSRSTPMTSVSSMRVHHSSATKVMAEEEFEDDNISYTDDISMRAHRSTIDSSEGLGSQQVHASSSMGAPQSSKEAERYSEDRNPLPTPVTGDGGSLGPPFSFYYDRSAKQPNAMSEQEVQLGKPQCSSKPQESAAMINETPDPTSARAQVYEAGPSTPFASTNLSATKQTRPSQPIRRNTLDSAYEFSDEEIPPEPILRVQPVTKFGDVPAPKPSAATTSAMGPPSSARKARTGKPSMPSASSKKKQRVSKPASRLSFTTPAAQKAIRQSILRMALDAEDFDELSLDKDDVVLVSSQPRTKPLSHANPIVKQENTPRPVPAASSRKRTFSTFREGASPDELAQEEQFPSLEAASAGKAQIKVEEDAATPDLPSTMPSRGTQKTRESLRPGAISSISNQQMVFRTSTPLLNLTPSHQNGGPKEIRDSTAEASSPTSPKQKPCPQRARTKRQRAADSSSSPLASLLTPTRKKPTGDFLKAENVTVVVKTPGGTFRRCGEDGFSCGRSFCFRCGSQSQGVSGR